MNELETKILAAIEGHDKNDITEAFMIILQKKLGFDDFMVLMKGHHLPY
jgi:hypothetical protein